jgi:3-dehydroquinate synthase/3-phosphoshikimate 1-carboxyvinyltransferase
MRSKMKRVDVNYIGGSYPVEIGVNYLNSTNEHLKKLKCTGKVLIVSDTNVFPLHGETLVKNIKRDGYQVRTHIIKAGEESKNLLTVKKIYDQLFEFGISRDDIIIALGGGVVGDITGFSAGTYLRGVKYIQIPTTLLAQVDSSVGGKTGVDTEHGKNQIGMFYQPSAVIIDVKLLVTLNKDTFNDGMAEVIKYGLIKDIELFNLIKENKHETNLEELIYKCISIKAEIVAKDEKDQGERMLLNFGHTFGHGIEKCGNFSQYTHGNAVAIGMVMAAQLGERMGITKEGTANEIISICKSFDLPTESNENIKSIMEAVLTDKKMSGASIRLILLKSIGESLIHHIRVSDLSKLMSNDLIVEPKHLKGMIEAIPSKSFLHRALICAGLSKGESTISNVIFSEDIIATIEAMRAIGAKIEINGENLIIEGIFSGKEIDLSSSESRHNNEISQTLDDKCIRINCNESGSTLRFLIPIIAALGFKAELIGKGRLPLRPINTYYKIFDESGISYSHPEGKSLPLKLDGKLKSGNYKILGDVSSQYITGLLLALPICDGNSTLEILPPFESRAYVDITISVMKAFGIKLIEEIENNISKFTIYGNQRYTSCDYEIEGDWSQASPWLCAGALNGEIEIYGLNTNSLQGDMEIINILKKFGAEVREYNKIIKNNGVDIIVNVVAISKVELQGITLDAGQIPDIIPVVAVVASLANGVTRIDNCGRLRFKESDRLEATAEMLSKLGADVKIDCDSLIITGKSQLEGGHIDSYKDHRIVMAASIAALRCKNSVRIDGYNAINKSYPKYFKDYLSLGGETDELDIW